MRQCKCFYKAGYKTIQNDENVEDQKVSATLKTPNQTNHIWSADTQHGYPP